MIRIQARRDNEILKEKTLDVELQHTDTILLSMLLEKQMMEYTAYHMYIYEDQAVSMIEEAIRLYTSRNQSPNRNTIWIDVTVGFDCKIRIKEIVPDANN